MRHMLVILLVVAVTPTLGAQNRSKLDDPVDGEFRVDSPRFLSPCHVGEAFEQFARRTNVSIGFEPTADCWLSGRVYRVAAATGEDLTAMSARQALNHLMTLLPGYRWKEMDGVVVIRRETAWDDRADPLNFPTGPFNATTEPLDEVLHLALQATTPLLFWPHVEVPRPDGPINRPISLAFSGGTMLEALNAIVRAHQGVGWQIGCSGQKSAIIAVSTLQLPHDGVVAPVRLPQVRREPCTHGSSRWR